MNDIVLICDENYAMPTEVMVRSISYNAEKYGGNYDVHVCSWDLPDENRERFICLGTEKVNVAVHIIDMERYKKYLNMINQNSHVTPTALLKFEIPNIFSNLDKILYLDSDMVVNGDMLDLFKLDIEDYFLAASYEFWKYQLMVYQYPKTTIIPDFYFNSGVMLMNLKKLRTERVVDQLWESKLKKFNQSTKGKFSLMDQDVFNDVCSGKVLPLPIRFNCNTRFTHDTKIQDINLVFKTSYRSLEELEDDAVILHFVGKEDKPWKYKNVHCQDIWDYYYAKTGYDLKTLMRISPERGVKYYIGCVIESVKNRGLLNTVRYIIDKFLMCVNSDSQKVKVK